MLLQSEEQQQCEMMSQRGLVSAGCTSAVDAADVVCPAGVRVWSGATTVLRHCGLLGVLHDLMAVHRVSHTHGARGTFFQNSCHTGTKFVHSQHLNNTISL